MGTVRLQALGARFQDSPRACGGAVAAAAAASAAEWQPGQLPELLHAFGLGPIAELETHREHYCFPAAAATLPGAPAAAAPAITVDVDHCPTCDYCVGEIERLCADQSEVAAAVLAIELLGGRLGVRMATKEHCVPSKVMTVLRTASPRHYATLQQAGVLS